MHGLIKTFQKRREKKLEKNNLLLLAKYEGQYTETENICGISMRSLD